MGSVKRKATTQSTPSGWRRFMHDGQPVFDAEPGRGVCSFLTEDGYVLSVKVRDDLDEQFLQLTKAKDYGSDTEGSETRLPYSKRKKLLSDKRHRLAAREYAKTRSIQPPISIDLEAVEWAQVLHLVMHGEVFFYEDNNGSPAPDGFDDRWFRFPGLYTNVRDDFSLATVTPVLKRFFDTELVPLPSTKAEADKLFLFACGECWFDSMYEIALAHGHLLGSDVMPWSLDEAYAQALGKGGELDWLDCFVEVLPKTMSEVANVDKMRRTVQERTLALMQ